MMRYITRKLGTSGRAKKKPTWFPVALWLWLRRWWLWMGWWSDQGRVGVGRVSRPVSYASRLALFVSHQGCRPVFSSACRRILYCTVVYCNQVTSYSTYVLSFLPSRRCRVHHRQRLLLPKPSYSKLHVP